MFWASFFYTFRLHTDPLDFTEALIRRYDIMPPSNIAMTDREQEMWVERKVVPVRLRVYNLLKAWLDTYWKPEADDVALETMKEFAIEVSSLLCLRWHHDCWKLSENVHLVLYRPQWTDRDHRLHRITITLDDRIQGHCQPTSCRSNRPYRYFHLMLPLPVQIQLDSASSRPYRRHP
jgi:hypothetical protein